MITDDDATRTPATYPDHIDTPEGPVTFFDPLGCRLNLVRQL